MIKPDYTRERYVTWDTLVSGTRGWFARFFVFSVWYFVRSLPEFSILFCLNLGGQLPVATSYILHPLTPSVLGPHPQVSVHLHWWPDWTFICCKTVADPCGSVTVLLPIAIRCFAVFTCFQILHKIRKFCMKFGQLILSKIIKTVAIRCQIWG